MAKQLIISVGREFGSGGHEIAERLAKLFDLPLYDNNILREIAVGKNLDHDRLVKYDENPRKRLFSRSVRGYSNSPEENIAQMQFDYLLEKAESGESFVVVGRCSEQILKEYEGLVSIFVIGDRDFKIKRTMEKDGVSEDKAKDMVSQKNKQRKYYHNYYCKKKWGDSRNYDICVNSGRLGIEKTTEWLAGYIKMHQEL